MTDRIDRAEGWPIMGDIDKPLSRFVRISLPPPRNISPEELKAVDYSDFFKSAGETFNLDAFK